MILPGVNQLLGLADSHQAGQPLCPAGAGNDAQIDFRLAELGAAGGDPDVTGLRQLTAAPQGIAVDCADHRFVQILQILQGGGGCPDHLIHVIPVMELLNVGSASKGFVPGPGDHHHLNGVVQPGLTHCGADVPPHFRAQGVAHLRTVEGKIQNSVPYFIQNIFKFHVQPHSFPLSAVLPACVASCKGKRYSKILQQFLCQVSNCRPADGRAAPLWVSIKVSAVFLPGGV